ncbi:MAG: pectinesterase family protein [Bacteroidota bacterium]
MAEEHVSIAGYHHCLIPMTRLLSLCIAGCSLLLVLSSGTALGGETVRRGVARDGSRPFRSIQDAIASLDSHDATPAIITVKNGLYAEQLFIRRSGVTIVGEDKDSTRIVFPVLRETWQHDHGGSDWGAGVVNIDTGVTDITLANLTVYNDYGGLYGAYNKHQFAIRGMGTRIILLHCAVLSDGGDAVSLWDRTDGMYYDADCEFEGWVDYVCPRGWCFITDSRFFGHNTKSASLWHDGSADSSQKFVIRNSFFDGRSGFPLGRNHRDGQVFLIHCRFSANMADQPFYRPPSSPAPWKWGDRHYYSGCYRDGGNFAWFADNLPSAEGAPASGQITARWTFDGRWDPEANPPSVLPYAYFPHPAADAQVDRQSGSTVRWTPGLDAVAHAVYFGPTITPPLRTVQSTTSYAPPEIQRGVTYYWRVDEITSQDTIRGRLWSFTISR